MCLNSKPKIILECVTLYNINIHLETSILIAINLKHNFELETISYYLESSELCPMFRIYLNVSNLIVMLPRLQRCVAVKIDDPNFV